MQSKGATKFLNLVVLKYSSSEEEKMEVNIYLKEILESIVRNLRKYCVPTLLNEKYRDAVNTLAEDGIYCDGTYFSPEDCENMRIKIDSHIESGDVNIWRDPQGADERIYYAEKIDPIFKRFFENEKIRDVLFCHTGISDPVGFVMAARITAKSYNLGSGGGWHRDSPVSHQFKAICYLSDVAAENGPFEYIKGSQRKLSIITSYLRGILKKGAYRFENREIDRYIDLTNLKAEALIAKEGSLIFADTKGIHRGRPIEKGTRYAVFCYFWDKKIPSHFAKYEQSDLK